MPTFISTSFEVLTNGILQKALPYIRFLWVILLPSNNQSAQQVLQCETFAYKFGSLNLFGFPTSEIIPISCRKATFAWFLSYVDLASALSALLFVYFVFLLFPSRKFVIFFPLQLFLFLPIHSILTCGIEMPQTSLVPHPSNCAPIVV